MVALAAGFLMVAAGFLMGMAAGTEAQSGAWASHWCGQSGCMQGGNGSMNHGRKQHDSHMGSKTYKQRQVCKVNSHWALARHQLFPSQSGRLVVVQCGALTSGPSAWLDLLGLVLGLLDLALSSLALGSLALGSWLLGLAILWLLGLGLVELVLEVVLVA